MKGSPNGNVKQREAALPLLSVRKDWNNRSKSIKIVKDKRDRETCLHFYMSVHLSCFIISKEMINRRQANRLYTHYCSQRWATQRFWLKDHKPLTNDAIMNMFSTSQFILLLLCLFLFFFVNYFYFYMWCWVFECMTNRRDLYERSIQNGHSLLQHESSLRGLYPISSQSSDLDFILLNLSYTWGF